MPDVIAGGEGVAVGGGRVEQDLSLGADLAQLLRHPVVGDDVGGVENDLLLGALAQLHQLIEQHRFLYRHLSGVGQQGDLPGGLGGGGVVAGGGETGGVAGFQLCQPLVQGLPCLLDGGTFRQIFVVVEQLAAVQGGDAAVVILHLVQGAVCGVCRVVHQHIPVPVLPAAVVAQEGVEAVAAAQQVGGVVGDEVLVVEPSH